MKYIATTILILTGLQINAQTNSSKNILTSYSKQQITCNNSVVNQYIGKYAQLANDFYTKTIDDDTYIGRLNILQRTYSGWLVNLSDSELDKLKTAYKLIQADGNTYLKKQAFKAAKEYALSEFKKNNIDLYNELAKAKIKFKNKDFEDYAKKLIALSLEQCSRNLSHKEYNTETLKLREQYADAIKTASKKDLKSLHLLNQQNIIDCMEHTIEQQYSL